VFGRDAGRDDLLLEKLFAPPDEALVEIGRVELSAWGCQSSESITSSCDGHQAARVARLSWPVGVACSRA
jgi:hypothetical protein